MNTLMDVGELRTRASNPDREGRPATATLTLGGNGDDLPAAGELAALLPLVPVAGVRLGKTADFSALPDHEIVRILALVRECSSIGVRVRWSLSLGPDQLDLVPRLDHLPAPDRGTVREWRSATHFGLLYFRKGPRFLSVIDNRPESSGRLVMDDPVTIDVFLQCLEGRAWAEVTGEPRGAAAATELVERGLILRVGTHCVTLPVHMRRWPLGAALLGGTLASAGKKPKEGH
jgi:hypothetical protein